MRATETTLASVQHIPAAHPYPLSITGPGVEALTDPPVPGAPPGRWWPHPALEPSWAAQTTADLVHLHFGFEHRTADELGAWVGELRRRGVALVVTVHDLVNPHLGPSRDYDALLDVVVPAADALTTLTPGAASEIRRRWDRTAVVHPHPYVVEASWLGRPREPHEGWVVGVHAKSLRASFDVAAVLRAASVVGALEDATLRIHVHEDVTNPDHPRADPRLLEAIRCNPRIDVRVHPPLDDDALFQDLLEVDLALLPYRFGTHSGWLEMCHDLGTDVLVADVGHVAEQRPVRRYGGNGALEAELRRAHAEHRAGLRPHRPSPAERDAERRQVQDLHERLYRDLLGARR